MYLVEFTGPAEAELHRHNNRRYIPRERKVLFYKPTNTFEPDGVSKLFSLNSYLIQREGLWDIMIIMSLYVCVCTTAYIRTCSLHKYDEYLNCVSYTVTSATICVCVCVMLCVMLCVMWGSASLLSLYLPALSLAPPPSSSERRPFARRRPAGQKGLLFLSRRLYLSLSVL